MANLTIVGTAATYKSAMHDLSRKKPDIVLMGLAGASDAPIRALRSQCPDARILVATAFQTGLTPSVAQEAGADICVSRAYGAPSLLPSLRKIAGTLNRPALHPMERDVSFADSPRVPPTCAADSISASERLHPAD
ncbi:hypothetical protein CRI94_10910 [Longibacter salinarum]|uniref:Response regulatory domain-containing protein n=2 Tax=Longibacter salinarum TaxID=1850348 RepID=A0A2A8CWP3_9BACT|nr:hypothetical protein CRI94_10910 [Longibacter salinarum]